MTKKHTHGKMERLLTSCLGGLRMVKTFGSTIEIGIGITAGAYMWHGLVYIPYLSDGRP